MAELSGRGVYYGATASEAISCQGDDVYVVGAANSAGQAALNLARYAKRVVMLVRGGRARDHHVPLSRRHGSSATAEHRGAAAHEVVAALGEDHLEGDHPARPGLGRGRGGTDELAVRVHRRVAAHRLAGRRGSPRRQGLRHHRTGPAAASRAAPWPLARVPFALETSVPGVFAAGDVRLDSMKRVASAVGEGAMSVYLVHRYLATI